MITEILENMPKQASIFQQKQDYILSKVTSDHLPQMFKIELLSNSESGEDSSSTATAKVNIVTWNILAQCKSKKGSAPSNNPWNHEESPQDFNKRLGVQAQKLQEYIKEGVDIFCLQECLGEDAAKIKEKLGNNFDYKTFEKLEQNEKGKQSFTFYDKTKFTFKEGKNTFFSPNNGKIGGSYLGLAITFEDIASKQNFVVQNTHGPFDKADLAKKNSKELKSLYPYIPVISVGDYNIDSSDLNEQEGVQTFACNLATNFDAKDPNDRGKEDVIMKTQNKCYDMAHVILPEGFSVDVKATYQHFTKNLEPQSIKLGAIKSKIHEAEDGYTSIENSDATILIEIDKITTPTQTSPAKTHKEALKQTLDQFKSGSVAFMRMGTKKVNGNNYTGYYTEEDFQNKEFSPTKQDDVVVLFGGNDSHITDPGSGGGGQARSAGPNGNPEGEGTFAFPITTTGKDKWFKDFKKGSIAKKNIEAEILVLKKAIDAGAKIVIPTDNNGLSSMPGNLSNSVFAGGENDTAKSVKNMISKELKRYGEGEKAKDTNLSIGAVLQLRNFVAERAKYFEGDNFEKKMKSYLAFIEENNTKSLEEMTEGLCKLIITNATHPTPPKSKPKKQNHRQADKEKVAVISKSPIPPSTILTSKSEKKITEEKIFEAVNSSSNVAIENLSAEDVAIRKATAAEQSLDNFKKTKEILESHGLLEYAAKGVLYKAIKAKNCSGSRDVNQENWDDDEYGGSNKAWYKRFTRINFKTVDLSETFRTVFVNCTFDENCVLPKDPSSIDPKYFSNCKFSKALMDKPENEALKKALEYAGMQPDGDTFYKIGRYAGINKEGEPNPNFKAIESFKLTSNYINKLNKTK